MNTIPKRIRMNVWGKYDHRCAYCGKELKYKEMQVDHVIPKCRGYDDDTLKLFKITRGEDNLDNYLPSCRSCNLRKRMNKLEVFRNELRFQSERAIKNYSQVRQSLDYGIYKFVEKPLVFYYEKRDVEDKIRKQLIMLGKKITDLIEGDIVHVVHNDIIEIERFKVEKILKDDKHKVFKYFLTSLERDYNLSFDCDIWYEFSDLYLDNGPLGTKTICTDRENAKMRFIEAWFSKNSNVN